MPWIDNSRILAIFAVIVVHVGAKVVDENTIGSEYWWYGNIFESLARWCVPVFVMISGALLLDPNKKEDLLTFYRKRLHRIFIPFLFWSVIYLYWVFFKADMVGIEINATDLLKRILSGVPYYHMWFLSMILCLYIFTPFLRKIVILSVQQEMRMLVIAMFLFAVVNSFYGVYSHHGEGLVIYWFLSYLPYFFLGYLIRMDDTCPSIYILLIVFILSVMATLLGSYFFSIKYFYNYLSLTVIPMSISLMYLLKIWKFPIINKKTAKKLSLLTLGIYLVHPLIIEIFEYLGFSSTAFNPLFSVPLVSVCVFICSLMCAKLIYQFPYLRRTI